MELRFMDEILDIEK